MEQTNKDQIDRLLEKIDRQLKKYKQYPSLDDIKTLIKDRVKNAKDKIICSDDIMEIIIEDTRISKLLKQKNDNYSTLGWIDVLTMQFLHMLGVKESTKQLLRANYNLESNNQIFRILNVIYNNDLNDSGVIDKNNYILKLNISFFLIEYIFETINKDLLNIIYSLDEWEKSIDNLVLKYRGDVQSIGDVLTSFKPKEEGARERYNLIKNYLLKKGYIPTKDSRFKYMRNASSHGEFYPDFENPANIKVTVEGHGVEKEVISYLDLITFVENKIGLLENKSAIELYLKLFRSNNLTNTILSLIEDENTKNELISKLCILSMFNIIQYNNENYFRVKKSDLKKESYADKIDLKTFFETSYAIEEKTNYEIMQTIKSSLGHMNVTFENGIFTFDNKFLNEQCRCSLASLLLFIIEDELYNLTISTAYHREYLKIHDQIRNSIMTNKIFEIKKYLPESIQKIWDQLGLVDQIDLSKYEFVDNDINKKI